MKTTYFLTAVAAVISLASCSSNDDEVTAYGDFPADGVIRVTAGVNQPISRAGMTTDMLAGNGFFLNINNTEDADYNYYAMMKKEAADGTATTDWRSYEPSASNPYTPLTMLWKNKRTPIKATAVALSDKHFTVTDFKEGITAKVAQHQTSGEIITTSDLLYMPERPIDPVKDLTGDGKIALTLSHRYSKLNLNIKLGVEFNATGTLTNPISEVAVNGTIINATFKAATNELALSGDATAVTPLHTDYTPGSAADAIHQTKANAQYECILLPQEVAADVFNVSFIINDKNYKWTFSNAVVTLAEGKAYNLDITVGKEMVQTGTMTVVEWIENKRPDITTNN